MAGALALGLYVRPRFTDNIYILCDHDEHAQIVSALAASGAVIAKAAPSISTLKYGDAEGYIILGGANSGAMRYALSHAMQRQVFSIKARIVSPQALLWLFLESDDRQNHADAIALIESGQVPLDETHDLLTCEAAHEALKLLEQLQACNQDVRRTWSYGDSVKARISRYSKKYVKPSEDF